jgi:hypothetical protein
MPRARLYETVWDEYGNPLEGATVTVREPNTATPVAATMYADDTGAATVPNPLTVDETGEVTFYLDAAQRVDLYVEYAGREARTIRDAPVLDPVFSGTVTLPSVTIDDSQVPASDGPASVDAILNQLANRVKAIIGGSDWYSAVGTSLAAVVSSLSAALHATTGHTHAGTTGNGPLLTDAGIATANKDGTAGTASLRTLGTGAQQAAAGTHTHGGGGTASASDPPTADNEITAKSLLKGWAYVEISGGVPSLFADYNVSGIVDDGVGLFTVTWDRDLASGDYGYLSGLRASSFIVLRLTAKSGGSASLTTVNASNTATDPTSFTLAAVGTLS